MWVVAGLAASALPEVDDFDGLFAVIVRGKESGFFLAPFMIARLSRCRLPMKKLALFGQHYLPHVLPNITKLILFNF